MGNRFLRRALREIAIESGVSPLFQQVIWAAPDVDASDFMISLSENVGGATLQDFAKGMTLYVFAAGQSVVAIRNAWRGV